MSFNEPTAVHGVGQMIVVMTYINSSHTRVMYPTWANGNGDKRWSPTADNGPAACAIARRHAWSNIAPFGLPVVPDVQTMARRSVSTIVGRFANGLSLYESRSAAIESVATDGSFTTSASVTITLGEDFAMMCSVSAGPSFGFMPLAIAPRRTTAWYATAYSIDDGNEIPTTSPRVTPIDESRVATPSAARAHSAKVIRARDSASPLPSTNAVTSPHSATTASKSSSRLA